MGDFISLLSSFNLTPLNTVLLVVLGLFSKWAVKELFRRLSAVEARNTAQDLALARIEERLGIGPLT